MPRYRVIPARLNVRAGPGTDRAVVGQLAAGAVIEPAGSVDTTAGDTWHALRLTSVGGAELVQPAEPTFVYAAHRYQGDPLTELVAETPAPAPAPTPTKRPLLFGVHCLADVGTAQRAAAAGAKAVTLINAFLEATQLRASGVEVIRRRWFASKPALMSGEQMVNLFYEGGNGGGYFAPIFNEGDHIGYGTPAEIAERAEYDRRIGPVIKARGGIYAAGGFSMGTPDFNSPEICDAIRREYAPGYNRGDYAICMHLYSPLAYDQGGRLIPISEWFGRRYEFLFTRCGFDPDPGLLGIVCDEAGEDEGGVGGFPAHGRTPAQVEAYYRMFVDAVRAPMVVGGKSYPSPVRIVTGFQASNDRGSWGGYDHTPYLAEIGRVAAYAMESR